MILAIDAGNTNITFSLAASGSHELLHTWRTATDGKRTADDYMVWLLPLMKLQKYNTDSIRQVVIASVVPECDFSLKNFARTLAGDTPLLLTAATIPLKINLPSPGEVGADRLVNAWAARELYGAPAIVLDFGTATTFDVLDSNGAYAGGVIAPGPDLSLQALYNAAAKLPKIAIGRPRQALGTTTVEAMQSGVYWGYIGLISGILQKLRSELLTRPAPIVIATGGLSNLFRDALPDVQHHDANLTMKGILGLAAIAS